MKDLKDLVHWHLGCCKQNEDEDDYNNGNGGSSIKMIVGVGSRGNKQLFEVLCVHGLDDVKRRCYSGVPYYTTSSSISK